ncbi:MAG: hypothetical protein J1G02_06740 [Clostridiales bacterium]|nr:hypothetical protein [Clostridiales bacterium]
MKKMYYASMIALFVYWIIPTIVIFDNRVHVGGFRFISTFRFIGVYTPFSQYLQIVALFLFVTCCILVFFKKTHKASKLLFLATLFLLIWRVLDEFDAFYEKSIALKISIIIGNCMWLVATTLFIIQFALSIHRRPSRVKQLEQQVADLQKQVDELKDKE